MYLVRSTRFFGRVQMQYLVHTRALISGSASVARSEKYAIYARMCA